MVVNFENQVKATNTRLDEILSFLTLNKETYMIKSINQRVKHKILVGNNKGDYRVLIPRVH
jgi:hypothetical protein